jgi:antitoxin component of RelBE/YafQ-DinJ toxin-antitoxin module
VKDGFIGFRLDSENKAKAEEIAELEALTVSEISVLALKQLIDQWEKKHGKVKG